MRAARADRMPSRLTVHSVTASHRYIIALALIMLAMASIYPLLAATSHIGTPDFHAVIEMTGAMIGLIAGFALVARFHALGTRMHLFIGLAFFVNGGEDFVHGLLSFSAVHGWADLPVSSLRQFIPGTYVTGRLLLGIILLLAPIISARLGESIDTRRETILVSTIVLVLAVAATALAFQLPLPQFIYPERFISRPVDFISALVLAAALIVFLREYHAKRDMLTWWVLLSIGINIVGQIMMSFSRELFDTFFDIAHVYKVLGYMAPLLGFSLYQIAVINENQRMERELLAAERLSVLGKVSGSIGHEIRNPLGVIDSSAYYLKMRLKDGDEKIVAHLNRIHDQTGIATSIIQALHDLVRVEQPHKAQVDLAATIEAGLGLAQLPAGVTVKNDVAAQEYMLSVDPAQMTMVVKNIAINASQAMSGQGAIHITATQGRGDSIDIAFSDSGPGIAPGDMERIFEPLFSTKVKGLGFGLALCKEIIEKHGGAITAQSQKGRGAYFTVRLPYDGGAGGKA